MDFFKNIPHGKADKPVLLMQGNEIAVNCDDADGQIAMLDRKFSGCITLSFSKTIDQNIAGVILFDGRPVKYFHHFLNYAGGLPLLGVYVSPFLDQYDHRYTLHVEGFTDTDGNVMDPIDIAVHTAAETVPDPEYAEREAVSLQAAEEGIVLMKNENAALPLPPGVLNIFGIGLHLFRDCGVGAGKINSRYTIGLKRAIRESQDFSLNEALADFYKNGDEQLPDERLLADARKQSDTAIIVLTRFGGENTDCSTLKGEFYLSEGEEQMIRMATERFAQTIVVLNVPCPIDVRFAERYGVDALVYSGFGGMLGGQALLNVLSGKTNPSGKLTDTWAMDYYDIPASKNFYDCAKDGPRLGADTDVWLDTVYEEDLYIGYRYFETFGVKPAYPFGYGLSYTTFAVESSSPDFDIEKGLNITAQVKNTGKTAGKEVVQVYIGKPDGKLEQPAKELVEFEKTVLLQPEAKQTLTFRIPMRHMVSYDESMAAYVLVPGQYRVYVGTSVSGAELAGSFVVKDEIITKKVKNRLLPVKPIKTLTKYNPKRSWPTGERSGVKEGVHRIEPARAEAPYTVSESPSAHEEPISFQQVLNNPDLAEAYAAQLSIGDLCRLTVCATSGWNMSSNGVSGCLAVPEDTNICPFAVSDGNSGVRVDPQNTGFPATSVYCATFNRQLVYKIGRILGEEAKERNVDLITGPGMNIHRNPLNGRNPEYFSEDPYLTGILSGTLAAGIEDTGVGACYKHLLANNCETSRKRNQSILTERAIREIYFRAFELAMEVHMPVSIMTSYNAVNGRHTAADTELIRGILREENNFDGFVMTDWNTYDSCDFVEIILGGNNWLTPGSTDDKFTKPLMEAVNSGRLPAAILRESVTYLLCTVATLHSRREGNSEK
jgi:beta-glucosidase